MTPIPMGRVAASAGAGRGPMSGVVLKALRGSPAAGPRGNGKGWGAESARPRRIGTIAPLRSRVAEVLGFLQLLRGLEVALMRYVVRFLVVLPLSLLALAPAATATPAAASSAFSFNWTSDPAAPAVWTPGTANDWDVIANVDAPTDATGTMAAGHGADCSAPPATHQISSLADSVYLCKNHMMTAVYGGGDAAATYGAVYFTPAQLLDWTSGTATLSWQVSTERLSARDWWAVNLTPFAQNLMLPLDNFLPAYQGEPASGLEMKLDQATCKGGGTGSYLRVSTVSFGGAKEITQGSPCVEDNVAPSFKVRTPFQVQLSAGHLKVFMPGTAAVWYDGPISLPFTQAVVQFSHHSYNPGKADNPDGSPGLPNTYHWSGVSIAPSAPFTIDRKSTRLNSSHGYISYAVF